MERERGTGQVLAADSEQPDDEWRPVWTGAAARSEGGRSAYQLSVPSAAAIVATSAHALSL